MYDYDTTMLYYKKCIINGANMKKKIIFYVILSIFVVAFAQLFTACGGPHEIYYHVFWYNQAGDIILEEDYKDGEIPEFKGEIPEPSQEFGSNEYEIVEFSYWSEFRQYSAIEGEIPHHGQNERYQIARPIREGRKLGE